MIGEHTSKQESHFPDSFISHGTDIQTIQICFTSFCKIWWKILLQKKLGFWIFPTWNSSLINITASEIKLPQLAKLSKHLAPWNTGWQCYLLKTKSYENHYCNVSPSFGFISTQREQLELETPGLLLNHCVRKGEKKRKPFVGFSISK